MTHQVTTGMPVGRTNPFDPPAQLGELRTDHPLTRITYADGHVGWLVTSYALVRSVLADDRFSSRSELQHPMLTDTGQTVMKGPPAEPGMFFTMDPPDHTRYRRLVSGEFTARRMRQLTGRIEEIAAEQLRTMREHGAPADLVTSFALPIPALVICELLGVPFAEREGFQQDTATALSMTSTLEESMAAYGRMQDFVHDLVRRKRAETSDDLLSGLILNEEKLDDEEIARIGSLLLLAGHETTANMLTLGTLALMSNPRTLAELRADPTVIDNVVEELMRYLTIIQVGITRTATRDLELAGELIKAGDTISVSLNAANRDPAQFDHPDDFDIHRSAAGHVGFGHGIHHCVGSQLARVEMRVSYAALFREFPELRLTTPIDELPLRTDMNVYGVHRLPVTW